MSKRGKHRRYTANEVRELIGGVQVGDLAEWIADEINSHIEAEEKATEVIEGFTDCGLPIVVDEYRLRDVLSPRNCQVCPCSKYCHKEHSWSHDKCVEAKIKYLKDELPTDTEEEEEE